MLFILPLVLGVCASAEGYNILTVFPAPTRSHNALGKGVVEALLKAGHNVTWVTPFPPNTRRKGLTVIDSETALLIKHYKVGFQLNMSIPEGLSMMRNNGMMTSLAALTPRLRSAMLEQKYDAVVTEYFFNEHEAGYAAVLQVPWITVIGTTLTPTLQSVLDVANTVPILPMMFTDFPLPMNFWQRMVTSAIYGAMTLMSWLETKTISDHYELMFGSIAAARGVKLPPYEDIYSNMSVVFANSHPSFTTPMSLAPNIVEVAGFHVDENIPELPEDLLKILNSSCVVYFSMGSVLQSAKFPEHTRRGLLEVFSRQQCAVLWKFEEDLTGLPANVFVKKWVPQAAVLAHPNIRAFITHGGMLSQIEAITQGVPLITIPVFGDQPANARRVEDLGFGKALTLDLETMPKQIGDALAEVLGNDSYHTRAKELSAVFKNRPASPSKLISHYIEVAIQTKGAPHLRSKAKLYSWYQIMMVDQMVFLIAVLLIACYISKRVTCKIISILFGTKTVSTNKKKVKKQ